MEQKPPNGEVTYDLMLLDQSKKKWNGSPGLRLLYGSIFQEIKKRLRVGPTLEIGSGIGNITECISGVVTSDVIKTPYVDRACSAYDISGPNNEVGWGNIVAIDVLHHLCRPMDFLSSAADALADEGRIILVEPAATPFGRMFYRFFHHEPIRLNEIVPPFEWQPDPDSGEFANMAMGIGLLKRHRDSFEKRLEVSGLSVSEIRFRDVLAYPATGGYSHRQFLPTRGLEWLLRIEALLPQAILSLIGLRMVVVLERVHRDPSLAPRPAT